MDTASARDGLDAQGLAQLMAFFTVVLPEFNRQRCHQKKRARRREMSLVLKAIALAVKAYPRGVPEHVADALRLMGELACVPNSRIARSLIRRSLDPELLRMATWPDEKFKKKFRVSKPLFRKILKGIESRIGQSARGKLYTRNKKLKVPPRRKLLCVLWYLTHGGDWETLEASCSLAPSTIRKYVIQVRAIGVAPRC
jgi:hypothetical protein